MGRFTGTFVLMVVMYFIGAFTFPPAWREWALRKVKNQRDRHAGRGLPPPRRPQDIDWREDISGTEGSSGDVVDYDPRIIASARRVLQRSGYIVVRRKEPKE